MTTHRTGLRERRKQTTKEALRAAALRLALERGPENVRVDDIAEAAGVSPRTYNNYFSSREHAIVSAVTADRESRIAAAVLAQPVGIRLSDAVIDAVVEQYTDPDDDAREALLMITTNPVLRDSYADSANSLADPLAEALITRISGIDRLTAQVLAGAVSTAAKVALQAWLQSTASPSANGFVVPAGSLQNLIRSALLPLVPALDAVSA